MKGEFKGSMKKIFLLFVVGIFSLFAMHAQGGGGITVKGNVKDTNGEEIIGASVLVKGATTGTATDIDGNFQLNVPSANSTLVVSYLGYKTQEVAIGGQRSLFITLHEDSEVLNEVVVIGYGSVKKEDATGSVVAIKAEEMNKGLTTSATDLLSGKVAGVNINTAGGEPGAGAAIRIRGGSSLSASNNPLIVIDGIPMNSEGPAGVSNPLSMINPADIETFTVLKDASATAIYGSRASNGVIIVTTKKGKSGQKLRVSYNGSVGLSLNKKTIDVLSANEYRNYIDANFANNADYDKIKNTLGEANTDWQDEVFRTGVNTDHNVSVLGSIGKVLPFRTSFGYTNQNGTLKNSNFERFTGSFNLSPSFFDNHLNVLVNAKGTYSEIKRADAGAVGAAASFDPTQVTKNDSPYGGYFTWVDGSGLPLSVATKNPLAMLNEKDDLSYVRTFVGNAQFDYKVHFFPDLKLNMNIGLDIADSNGIKMTDPRSAIEYTEGGYLEKWTGIRRNTLFDFFGQYVKEVEPLKSKFDVMGGYSWQRFFRSDYNPKYRIPNGIDGEREPINKDVAYSHHPAEYYLVSFFGRFNYTLMDRYLFTFTMRRDGTSRFDKDHRWGTFPSLALGWKMKEENFLKDVDFLSDLKLRLGWGITGQQNLGDDPKYYYPSMSQYSQSKGQASYFMGYDANGNAIWIPVVRPSAYNKDLKWEQTTTYNVGLDFGFLNNRITGSFDYYVRKTKDLLNTEVKVAAGANVGEFVASNVGNLENKGFEFTVNAKPIVTKDLVWDLGYNISVNKTKLTKVSAASEQSLGKPQGWVGGDGGTYSQMHSAGHAPYAFYVYEQVYDDNGKPIEGVYVDQNGDGVIDEKDKIFFKKPAADVTMGFNSKWTYKNWDLGFNGRVSLGNYVYNGVEATHADLSINSIYNNGFTSNIYRSALSTNFHSKQLLSSHYVQNASFLKLDNITLGYTFDNLFGKGTTARFYGTVQNVFCITPYSGIDPEVDGTNVGQAGIDNNVYPRPLSFMLGVNLNF